MPPSTENPDIESFYEEFRRDVHVFEEKLPDLLEKWPGDFVAVLDGEIVDHDANWEELEKKTRRTFPNRFVFLERVVPKEKVTVDMDTLEG